jgi:hypothetical protein
MSRSFSRRATSASLRPSTRRRLRVADSTPSAVLTSVSADGVVGFGLLELTLRCGFGLIKAGLPVEGSLGEGELRFALVEALHRGDQIRLRLHHLRDCRSRTGIAAFHRVADLGNQSRHAAREGCQNQGAGVLVERDLADGLLLDAKHGRLDFDDTELVQLVGRNANRGRPLAMRLGRLRRGKIASSHQRDQQGSAQRRRLELDTYVPARWARDRAVDSTHHECTRVLHEGSVGTYHCCFPPVPPAAAERLEESDRIGKDGGLRLDPRQRCLQIGLLRAEETRKADLSAARSGRERARCSAPPTSPPQSPR